MYSHSTKFFLTTATESSFSKAAKKLYVSPTAVMNQIDLFEAKIGYKVFDRTPQGVHLTEAGEFLYLELTRLDQQICAAVFNASKLAKHPSPQTVKVGHSYLFPCTFLAQLWDGLKDQYRNYNIELVQIDDDIDHPALIFEKLGSGIDLLLCSLDSVSMKKDYKMLPLGVCHFAVCVPVGHRLNTMESLSLEDLHGETLAAAYPSDHPVYQEYYEYIIHQHPQINVQPSFQNMTISTMNRCEAEGILLLSLDYYQYAHPLLKTIPLKDGHPTPYGVIYSAKAAPYVTCFVDLLYHAAKLKEKALPLL